MDIGKSFSYVFEDPRWVSKVAIGGAILLVGTILVFLVAIPTIAALIIVFGYMLVVIKNVSEGSTTPLPEWTDFGGLFMKGLYASIGAIVVFIPAILLICCSAGTNFVIGAAQSNSQNGGGSGGAAAFTAIAFCFQCLIFLYSLVASIYLYAPVTRYALGAPLSVFWDFRGNLSFIQANTGGYVIALIVTVIAGFIGQLGFILCIIPGFFTWFWSYLVTAHIFGQFAKGAPSMTPMAPMAPPPMAPVAPVQ